MACERVTVHLYVSICNNCMYQYAKCDTYQELFTTVYCILGGMTPQTKRTFLWLNKYHLRHLGTVFKIIIMRLMDII